MTAVFLCVLASVAVSVLFKWARPRGLDAVQAVAVNYIVAAVLCFAVLHPDVSRESVRALPPNLIVLLGVLLPTVFVMMANAVKHAGMVRADAAQRLSLLLPLLAAVLLFGETPSALKTAGMVLALLAVAALVWKPSAAHGKAAPGSGVLLLAVCAGYGVIDVLFKQVAKTGSQFALVLWVTFVLAAVLMAAYLLLRRTRWSGFSLACGVLLGGLNFANIYFYIMAHQALHASPSVVFAAVNLGVLALASLLGLAVWRERLSLINGAGLLLAAAAVGCLYVAAGG